MADNYIDVKETIWRRFHFSDTADMEKLVQELKENSFDNIDIDAAGFQEAEVLYDTAEALEPDQNCGEPTIEVYNKKQMIWDNENSL